MIIDQKFLDSLSAHAKANPRLRQSYDLRTTPDDKSLRMLNALEPGTIMPIHRHRNTSETMVMVRGKLIERFYDGDGSITDEFVMEPCGNTLLFKLKLVNGILLKFSKKVLSSLRLRMGRMNLSLI